MYYKPTMYQRVGSLLVGVRSLFFKFLLLVSYFVRYLVQSAFLGLLGAIVIYLGLNLLSSSIHILRINFAASFGLGFLIAAAFMAFFMIRKWMK